jgi:CTP:molybdopterin cytidylyltransferase MocA
MTAGIVLAAGAGTRYGQPKAPVVVDGERLVDRAVRNLRTAGCDPVFVVLGAWEGQVPDALVIINHGWEEGMGSSLRIGLKWARATSELDDDEVIITLVDLPGLTPEAVSRVMDARGDVVIAAFDGVRGHPVKIAKKYWQELIDTVAGDEGARNFLHNSDAALVEVGDVADGSDMDVSNG